MPTGLFCGVPIFRKKSERKARGESKKYAKTVRIVKAPKVERSSRVASNFVRMTELRNKISSFRDLLDFSPAPGSDAVNELLVLTLNDLFKRYPKIKPMSELEGPSLHKALKIFCDALKSLGDLWTTEKWLVKCKYNSFKKIGHAELEKTALAMLDDIIKLGRERLFDEMDDNFDARCNDAFAKAMSDSSDNRTSFSSSPETPTSVLSRSWKLSSVHEKGSYSPPLLFPLRVQSVGKLSPIDVKRLNFHMFPHAVTLAKDPKYAVLLNNMEREEELSPVNVNWKDLDDEIIGELEMNNEDNRESEMNRDSPKIARTGSVGRKWKNNQPQPNSLKQEIDICVSPTPLPPPPPSPITPTNLAPLPPSPPPTPPLPVSFEGVASPPLPPPPLPPPSPEATSAFAPPPPPPPPLSISKRKGAAPSPPSPDASKGNEAAVPPPPPPPTTTSASTPIAPLPSPPPPLSILKRKGAAPPPPSPPPTGASKGNEATVRPPPPIATSKGYGALPPPPPGVMSTSPRKMATRLKRSSDIGNLYRALKGKVEGSSLEGKSSERKGKVGGVAGASGGKMGMADALAEMTKRSAYFQQIEEDAKTYAETIKKVQAAIYSFQTSDMTELLKFHKYVESHLEKLSDETQVLARFEDFPIRKLEALRMAAALYLKLDSVVTTLQNLTTDMPVGKLLDKAESYFNKIKVDIDALERTKDDETKRLQAQKISFNFGILLRIKELMVDVSSNCMELALKEKTEATDTENTDETPERKKNGSANMLWRAFQFAFRVYTFAGGHDERADKLARELATQIQNES